MAIRLAVASLLLVTALCLLHDTHAIPYYCNGWTNICIYSSPTNRVISGIYSRRTNGVLKDRRYAFTSHDVSPSPLSHLVSYRRVPLSSEFTLGLTGYTFSWSRSCYKNGKWGALTRVKIYYSSTSKDRRFRFYCRWLGTNGSIKYKVASCSNMSWTSFNAHFAKDLAYNRVIIKMTSSFSNTSRDRKFRIRTCLVVKDLGWIEAAS